MTEVKKRVVKWDIDKVRYFVEVESESGCMLISEEYVNNASVLEFRCNCGDLFEATWSKFKSRNKRQCNDCGYDITRQMRLKTHSEFCDEVKAIVGEEYLVKGRYLGNKRNVTFTHFICNRDFDMAPSNFLRGQRCPQCQQEAETQKATKTNGTFIQEVEDLVGQEYLFLEDYVKASIPIMVLHTVCNHKYKVTPNHFLISQTRCPRCDNERKALVAKRSRKTHKEFVEEVYGLVGEEYEVIGKYKRAITKVTILHKTCGREFNMEPTNFLSNQRCPHCRLSKGATAIQQLLERKQIIFTQEKRFNKCRDVKPLPFDFYIENKFLIEYDGHQHFFPVRFNSVSDEQSVDDFKSTQKRDCIKNQYCIDNNIPLLRIPYWEFDNIEKILESALVCFNVIENNVNYDVGQFEQYLVGKDWNHDEYISKCSKNNN